MGLLGAIDWLVILAYFLAVFAVAYGVTKRESTRATAEGYFLSGRDTGWFVIGFLLFATVLAFLSYKQIWAGIKPKKG